MADAIARLGADPGDAGMRAPSNHQPILNGAPLDLADFFRRHLRAIILATILSLLFALAFSVLSAPKYRSSAQLLIDPRGLQILKNEITRGGESTDGNLVDIENQRYVLLSRSILQAVVDKARLADNPLFGGSGPGMLARALSVVGIAPKPIDHNARALNALVESVEVVRGERAYVLDVAVTTRDPVLSADLANMIARVYLDSQNDARADASRRASESLTSRANELRREVQAAEDKVEQFRTQKNLTIGPNGRLIGEQQMADLSYQLGLVRAKMADAQSRLTEIDRIKKSGLRLDSMSESLNSPTIAALRAQAAQAAQQQAALAGQLGARHPALQAAQDQARDVQKLIVAELDRVSSSAKTDLDRAKGSEKGIEKQIDDIRQITNKNNPSLVELRDLERAAETNRSIYTAFLTRAKELDQSQNIDTANARVISPAIPAMRASGPPLSVLLAGGLIFGLGAGTGCGYLSDFLRGRSKRKDEVAATDAATPRNAAVVTDTSGLELLAIFNARAPQRRRLSGRMSEAGPLLHDEVPLRDLLNALDDLQSGGRTRPVGIVSARDGTLKAQLVAALADHARHEGFATGLVEHGANARAEYASLNKTAEDAAIEITDSDTIANTRRGAYRGLRAGLMAMASGLDLVIVDVPAVLDDAHRDTDINVLDHIIIVAEPGDSTQDIDALLDALEGHHDRIAGLVRIVAGEP